MIINCVKTGKTSGNGINKQEYKNHNDTIFLKKIITSTCSGVATIMKNYRRHVLEKKKVKIPHRKKYSISLNNQSFDIRYVHFINNFIHFRIYIISILRNILVFYDQFFQFPHHLYSFHINMIHSWLFKGFNYGFCKIILRAMYILSLGKNL